jgi:hypothetical protein
MADDEGRQIMLAADEVALIIGGATEMSLRIAAGSAAPDDGSDLSDAAEIVLALATRLLEDAEFHGAMLDWYYAQLDRGES